MIFLSVVQFIHFQLSLGQNQLKGLPFRPYFWSTGVSGSSKSVSFLEFYALNWQLLKVLLLQLHVQDFMFNRVFL